MPQSLTQGNENAFFGPRRHEFAPQDPYGDTGAFLSAQAEAEIPIAHAARQICAIGIGVFHNYKFLMIFINP